MALNISSNIVASEKGRELVQHGSALFPIACYAEDLSSYSVAWHWHEEFEYVLCTKGPLHVDVNKTHLTLQTGQGVFINSGVLHAVEQAPEGTALLHSGVFHPRLVGGMDTIFWQKLIRRGRNRCWTVCTRAGKPCRTNHSTTRTGCATTSLWPCGC